MKTLKEVAEYKFGYESTKNEDFKSIEITLDEQFPYIGFPARIISLLDSHNDKSSYEIIDDKTLLVKFDKQSVILYSGIKDRGWYPEGVYVLLRSWLSQ
jgi:hypothetical protein